ncbi:TonB-dependent receptor [Erythrobacter arachoides]|uniref:TonB-dependent receptor n=1 Tax=Aurantiacibacter arachoides TaxID=1850444 RepID=A0A845A0R8_9SPHN|nr:TonB-dependent receptor [Aurantiacibacter arachoides]MXO94083.1 TonB-dependent receptor [Aurantiacibacter arachoides]GGD66182.1 TonB-dependent receptor [Aurantiacibacter arachoides]
MTIRNLLRSGASTTAFTVAAFALPSVALAQVDPADQSDEATVGDQDDVAQGEAIIVSGYRQALESAINTKRESSVIVEAFSAEDIGKLPDISIAETLGRLPGLAVQRIDGRAQSLSIRGLGPDYGTSLLNGRQLVSSGDNRAVEYDQYPSELINSGVVYKTPFAGLIGQGLAGTVDLRTIRPLDQADRIVSLSGRLEFNEDGSLNPDIEGWGYRATGTFVDQFANDTLGVALGVAYQSSPSQVRRFNAWGYPDDAGFAVLGGMKPYARSVDLDRLGVFGTLEWEPSPEWNSTLDVFYADYRERIPQRGIEFPLNPGWGSGATITGNSGGDFPDSVTFTGVQPVVRNDFDRKDTETFAIGWNTSYDTDDVLLSLDIAYSSADRRLQQIESNSGLSYAANPAAPSDTVTYTRNPGGFPFQFTNQIDYSDTNLIQLTDPRGWGAGGIVQAGFINDTATEDELWTVRAEAALARQAFDGLEAVVLGLAYDDRTKSRDITQNFLSLSGGPSVYAGQGAVTRLPIPTDALLDPTSSLGFLGFGPQVAYDPFVLLNNGTYVLTDVQSSDLPFPGDWTVNEKVYTGYARFDLDTEMLGMPMTGNAGLQFVYTDQSSTGFNSSGGIGAQLTPTEGGDEYFHVLPSATFSFEVGDNTLLRLGAARTLARPRMDQLNASYNASIANTVLPGQFTIFGGGGGNPELRPYVADSVDVSFEHYFAGRQGYFALASYYKWLSDFVNPNAVVVRDFSYLVPILNAQQQAAFAATGNNTLGFVGGPDNQADGHIFGVEASLSLPFGSLFDALEGFGFQTSVSYTDSQLEITPDQGDPFDTDVPGLSKWVVNSTLFFETGGFEARVSHRYRTEFLAEFIGISASRSFRETEPESIFDAQIGYRFDSGMLDGLSLTLQALNLTDEPFVSFQNGDREQIIDYEQYGRTYLIGASYRF